MDFPSTDEEFRRAIKALDASTHAIERQGRAFNSQATYLRNLRANEDTANERRNTHASYLSQRQAAELQYITFAVISLPYLSQTPWNMWLKPMAE